MALSVRWVPATSVEWRSMGARTGGLASSSANPGWWSILLTDRSEVEVVVVGAGPAGIAAATVAAEGGAQVLVIDENGSPGGQIWRGGVEGPPLPAKRWLKRFERAGVECLRSAAVIDISAGGSLIVEQDAKRLDIVAQKIVLATGARELFLPFPGWTLPGVVGIGAAQALLKGGLRIRNVPTIVSGTGPLVLPVASALSAAGASLDLVAEQADIGELVRFASALWRYPGKLVEAARYRLRFLGCSYLSGHWVVSAHGDSRLREVEMTDGKRIWSQPCELLCSSYGLVPNIELAQWLGCDIEGDRVVVGSDQQTTVEGIFCAGEPTGVGGVELALVEGQIAGLVASDRGDIADQLVRARQRLKRFEALLASAFRPRAELRARLTPTTTICRCEDVEWNQIEPEWGFRQAKLYARVGMGVCQSRVCGPALSFLCGWETGTVRPPVKSCKIETLIH